MSGKQEELVELHMHVRKVMAEVSEFREELIKAFLAKWGCEPEECEQIITNYDSGEQGWYVQKKELNHG